MAKAGEFLRAAEAAHARDDHSVAVSNAVHAGILAVAAYLATRHGRRVTGHDHREAVNVLQRLTRGEAERQATALGRLLRLKSMAEYAPRASSPPEARDALVRAGRLVEWANRAIGGRGT